MKDIGKGLASLGICAVVGVAVCITGSPYCLWALLALMVVW